jgi:hypothetical protein
MKERLNLTIDAALLDAIKRYAVKREISVSELVENYFEKVTKPIQRKTILDLLDELVAPDIDPRSDLKELLHKKPEVKYGL